MPASAQTTQNARAPVPAPLPDNVVAALDAVEDFSLSFSNPGFYAVLEYVHSMPGSPGLTRKPLILDDWTALLERPDDFRGLPISLEGVVGRNKTWRLQQPRGRDLGSLWQLELTRSSQPIAVTAVLTENADDIPVGATVRVTGYFVMIRQYYSAKKRLCQAALIVGHGPSLVENTAAPVSRKPAASFVAGSVIAACVALFITWLLLRGSYGRSPRPERVPNSSGPAPLDLSRDLATWAVNESPKHEDEPEDRSTET